ncbi:MAG: quinate 5-dehydrogenase [Firmicutes bacterium]|nr:quinate 5-dehydrogenase [Bacillota bacterium]
MKRVVSVSLGSSKRDHAARVTLLDEPLELRRVGADGSMERALELLREFDGRVDAIGLGGLDVYLNIDGERFVIQDGLRLMQAVRVTPVVDGSRVKDTMERRAVRWLAEHGPVPLRGARVLMVSSLDRWGMAETLAEVGADVVYGDLMFAAGVPYPIRTLEELKELGRKMAREICKLPIHMIYPVGEKQEREPEEKFPEYYREAQVVAGDFHLIRRYMPRDMAGKMVLTQTTTAADREFMRERGVRWVVTTTPVLDGRSFGTNLIEAALVALLGRRPEELTPEDFHRVLDRMDYRPTVIDLQS